MFQSARIQLTAWYLLIIMCICLLYGVSIYADINRELEQIKYIQINRIERQMEGLPPTRLERKIPPVDPAVIEAVQHRLRIVLILVNLGILGVSGIAAYFLAGKTLKPIQDMLDKQNQFIADASHEIRTPLTAMKTSIEVNLRDKHLDLKTAKELLQDNLNDIQTLKSLSDNLLTLTSIPNARTTFEIVGLKEVLQYAIDKVSCPAKEKHISIISNLHEMSVKGDKNRLQEVFLILLDNAVKYSPEKSTIHISNHKVSSHIEVKIKDEGLGIAEKDLPHIFERFYRADTSRTHSKKDGYGLGLAIAKEIIDNHKGKIKVESKVGEGTTFTIHIPLKV